MNFLGELIPAIREIRAPLVGGYLWLLAMWLKFGGHVPDAAAIPHHSVWENLNRLSGVTGAISIVVILSVAAYLLGSLIGELLSLVISWRIHFDEHMLERQSAVAPEVRYLFDHAARAYAEAQLRFHVALPTAAIAFILPGWWAHILTLAAAVLLFLHGSYYISRASKRYYVAQSLVRRHQEDIELSRSSANTAELVARVQRRGEERVLTITNRGPGIARSIDVRTADGNLPPFIIEGYFPIEELRPNDAVDVLLAVSFGTAKSTKVILSWEDGTGPRQDAVTLHVLY